MLVLTLTLLVLVRRINLLTEYSQGIPQDHKAQWFLINPVSTADEVTVSTCHEENMVDTYIRILEVYVFSLYN